MHLSLQNHIHFVVLNILLRFPLHGAFSAGAGARVTFLRRRRSVRVANNMSTTPPARLPSLSKKVRATLDPCVVLMKDLIGQYADLWKDRGGIFSLAQGVVYWKPPPQAVEAVRDALLSENSDLHMYGPDEGLQELRDRLQEKIQQENGLTNHDVMVTVGANQAFVNSVLTLLEDTDKCVVFKPYYFNHVMALQMTLPESCLVVGPVSDAGLPDLKWLESRLKDDSSIKMVTLVNPGNPTGTYLNRDFVQKVVDLCREHTCWLILDVTYEYFVRSSTFDGCFPDPHVLHIFSLSKAYALAGYRCGYIAINKDAEGVYEQMMKVQDTIPIATSRVAQVAALGALEAGKDWVQSRVETLEQGREAILHALSTLEQIMGGSGAMYVMAKLPVEDDQAVAKQLVRDYGVAVIPGSFCGYPGWIRVCYANLPPDKCLQAAARLEEGLKNILA
jgi:aspartate/methionine/tyrosine aminotransferase